MASVETFEGLRPRLLAIAYRMLSSSAEAEDAVQDTWLRWQDIDEADIRNPSAWLTTTLSRICIDRLTSARSRRETYVGPWLPEPVVTSTPLDVESISMGFLVLLETLTPLERAVFILHNAFDCSHGEIAAALGLTDVAVRQIFHRAEQHLAAHPPRFAATREDHLRLLTTFMGTLSTGDLPGLAKPFGPRRHLACRQWRQSAPATNAIQQLLTDGFEVGSSKAANPTAGVCGYAAFAK